LALKYPAKAGTSGHEPFANIVFMAKPYGCAMNFCERRKAA
jgi:hypothetical protein